MPEPKQGMRTGQLIHYSVGLVARCGGKVLLVDRNSLPIGLAGIAGHIDEGEEPASAIVREVNEESGLVLASVQQIREEFVAWNACSKGVTGHHWYLFEGNVSGTPSTNPREVRSIGWYAVTDLPNLNLEPVWRHWFEQLGLV